MQIEPDCPSNGICVQSRPINESVDRDTLRNINPPRFVLLSGEEACAKRQCLNNEVRRINSLNAPYEDLFSDGTIVGANSNTVIRTMLEKCGLPEYAPSAPFAPGWSSTALE